MNTEISYLRDLMSRLFSALRIISVLFLLGVLLYVYANISEMVTLQTNEAGMSDGIISKSSFFYLALLIIVVINGGFHTLINLFKKSGNQTPMYTEALLIWLNGLTILLNAFFITSLIFINAYNSLGVSNIGNFGVVLFTVMVLTTLWISGIVFVLRYRGT